jgi:tRNA A37 threonylcarbamoyladenosine synthetase subunit TsaC/SUA5/YrdC
LVESFEWLAKNTELTTDQISFLKAYHRPFTVLAQSIPVRTYLEFSTDDEEALINKDIYKNISFRVAHHPAHKKLLKTTGPLWLTSANIATAGETYSPKKIIEDF